MLKQFFFLSNIIFFYIEFDFFIFYSTLGIIKIKNKNLTHYLLKANTLLTLANNTTLVFFMNIIDKLINFGYVNKFKLVGVGYRQFYSNNIIVFKLWYSHLVYKILPLNILTFKKNKKKPFFCLYSLDKNNLNRVLHLWLSYRIRNTYTKKGFLKKNKEYYTKPIIKKLI